MSDDDFDGQILAEKLAKLNSSQQSIESLSRWCITHRKKAKQIVETWEKVFKSAPREQHVSFLYLANDILQNSRRKGSEFVNEFWKFLPVALRHVYDGGDENGKKAASRLVDIWEERKVFGSRGQNLKDEMLGKNPPPTASNGKSSNPIKVVKRDAQSLRIKLAIGGLPEKIVSAFQLVHEENVNEEAAFSKCKSAISWVQELGKDIESSSAPGNLQGSELVDKIQEQENTLKHCVSQLENFETTRLALVSQLKEALRDQESKLELIRNELEVARSQIEQALYVKQKLISSSNFALQPTAGNPLVEVARVAEANLPSTQLSSTPLLPPTHPMTFTSKLNEEESKKAAAAAVVAKLAASTSSAQMLTSVLSSLVAEEVASMSNGLNSTGFSSRLPFGSPEKRPKLEKRASFSDVNLSDGGHSAFFASAQQTLSNMPVGASNGMQVMSQGNQIQASFAQPPPPPPPPPPSQALPPANSPATQLGQSAAMMIGVPYGYGSSNLPPPPLPPHMPMGFARPAPLPTQQPPPQQLQNQQQSQQQQQQQPATGGYYRPPGIGFYGQSHQSATPPVPRQ